jgi:arylsulfatase A-like enzyme
MAAVLALCAIAGVEALNQAPAPPAQTAAAPPPKLVVIIVVDQMRPTYLERHASRFTGGLKRLIQDGAWFEGAAYPYLNTVTCAGHSTIGTGSFPYRHGMILNAWYDRTAGTSVECTRDDAVTEISYSGASGTGDSGKWLLMPTLADRLREQQKGRVVSLSLKPRSAIGMAGRGADAVLWYDDRGGWATSSAFSPGPVPFIKRFLDANPLSEDFGKTWTRTLDDAAYEQGDDRQGERAPAGWTRTFPHEIGKPGGRPDGAFYTQWARSPFADEYLGRMAADAVDALKLGRGAGTDFLGVSFSTLDLVGHAFGPESHEVQDIVIRLDRTIGRLLDHLDARVGRANYVLALSSDHGVAGVPEQVTGGGRQTSADVRGAIDGALTPILGPPPAPALRPNAAPTSNPPRASYMAYSAYTDIYLAAGVMDRLKQDDKAMRAVLSALGALPGIVEVFRGDDLARLEAREDANRVRRAAALSYHPSRSGDIIIVPRENWILSSAATTHGTLYWYDQHVPVLFYGAGVKPGRYTVEATPADIAPTLAALARVPFDRSDGRALAEAVAQPVPAR